MSQGCVDLVVGGHLHVRVGPNRVEGENGNVGYTYTTGTTGGAAYAIAIGSKPRRDAMISLVTYADGPPVAIQSVLLQTNGVFRVAEPVELDLGPAAPEPSVESGVKSRGSPAPTPLTREVALAPARWQLWSLEVGVVVTRGGSCGRHPARGPHDSPRE